MSTFFWILSIYLLTVVISYPFLRRTMLNMSDDERSHLNPFFAAKIIAFVPLYNLHAALKAAIQFIALRIVRHKLKKLTKGIGDPETKKQLEEIVDGLGQISNPNNKEYE